MTLSQANKVAEASEGDPNEYKKERNYASAIQILMVIILLISIKLKIQVPKAKELLKIENM